MSLREKLAAVKDGFAEKSNEETRRAMARATRELEASDILTGIPAPGDRAPDFTLTDTGGTDLGLSDFLTRRAVVLTFYRGSW